MELFLLDVQSFFRVKPLDNSAGKESACDAGDPRFNSWVGKIHWRRDRLPTPVFWPGEFHGLYSLWGCKESDTTEQLSLHFLRNITTHGMSSIHHEHLSIRDFIRGSVRTQST